MKRELTVFASFTNAEPSEEASDFKFGGPSKFVVKEVDERADPHALLQEPLTEFVSPFYYMTLFSRGGTSITISAISKN